jgi:glutathione S-transferase
MALGEAGYVVELAEERVWDRREDFLIMNPAGTLPVLVDDGGRTVAGIQAVTEYLEEVSQADDRRSLIPGTIHGRAEVRRLVEWFDVKFFNEVSQLILHQKVDRRFMDPAQGGGGPNMEAVRVGKHNLQYHVQYVGYLTENRRWLAGDDLSHADLAAAAHLSCLDFLGDVPWEASESTKQWYARLKSRPSFRPLLKDQLPGITPPAYYEDLDF